ncbi:GNAT family N-acetyltransferase [Saccharococcus sp. Marseille-Q5394]|uniref:GNAT family N-acetyltransferase n=1 Tax=Saccharococcus sp. Marseille-Q5394 TaxID=2972778 RepID=UPI0021CA6850|nr:GNAT family N-acetyltransferase [Saccharococcus sp. Marseille-Q5394]
MIAREIEITDAEKLSLLIQLVEASSEYMLWEAGEREVEGERQKKMIESMKDSNNSTILVAENKNNELVGYLFAIGGNAKRSKHSAYIVIGISENYRGQGVGTKLFKELEQWAAQHDIHRLELTVVTRNQVGLSLYKKMGFEVEGTKRHSLLINDEFVDEYYMSKLISPVL